MQQTTDRRHVDVSVAIQATGEVRCVMIGAEQAAKLRVEDFLGGVSVSQATEKGRRSVWCQLKTYKCTFV